MSEKMTTCSKCKQEVGQSVKECPHCGQKYPWVNTKQTSIGCLIIIVAIVGVISLVRLIDGDVSQQKKLPDMSLAKPYEVVSSNDFSFPGRKRVSRSIIAPSAKSYEERAHTAIKAAYDLQKESGAVVASIWVLSSPLLDGKGDLFALSNYAIDGSGYSGNQGWTWEVSASRQQPSETDILILELWAALRQKVIDSGSEFNEEMEKTVKNVIAKELNLPSNFRMPMIHTSKYLAE